MTGTISAVSSLVISANAVRDALIAVAVLAAAVALILAALAAAASQDTIKEWIRYRAAHRVARSHEYAVKRLARAVTSDRRRSREGAADFWKNAASSGGPPTGLAEIMRITRSPDSTEPQAGCQAASCCPRHAGSPRRRSAGSNDP